MIELFPLGRSDLLAYRVADVITEADVRVATEAFDAILADHPTAHVYCEVESLRGLEARALWLDLVYSLRHVGALRHIGRVALVTDVDWIRRLARIEARLIPIGRLNVYAPDDRDEARAWVLNAPTVAEAWDDADWLGEDDEADAPTSGPSHAPRFGHTVHRTYVLLRVVADDLGTDATQAYHALRAVLHVLRDRLPDAEAADLAAQLTTMVRGVFYEGYRPGREAGKVGREALLATVASGLPDDAAFDAEAAVRAVARALADTVSEGEWAQVLNSLPRDLRALFEAPVEA